jgi:hypothetical protein
MWRVMGAAFDVDQLVGAAEIADRLGLQSTSVIHDWRQRHSDFPQPVLTLRMGLLWHWPAIERWARKTGRLSGRPAKK